jgi:hypothetical protein
MKTLPFIGCTLGIVLSLSACADDPVLLGEIIRGTEGSDDEPNGSDDELNSFPGCETRNGDLENPCFPVVDVTSDLEASKVLVKEDILLPYCGECHEAPAEEGGLSAIGDLDELVSLGLIVPGDKYESRIYLRMADRTMPPYGFDSPLDREIVFVGNVINALDD